MAKVAKKSSGKTVAKKTTKPNKPLTKMQVADELKAGLEAAGHEISLKAAKAIGIVLIDLVSAEVKKKGVFVMPGLARFIKRVRPAVKANSKKVRNPATGEMIWQKARPASIVVKIRTAKALKDAVN